MGLFSDFLNAGVQLQVNKENQENALEMQERNFYNNEQSANNAFARQKQFYEAYQTPMAMRRMLEEAGYSKELYGGQLGTTGGVSGQGKGNTGTPSVSKAPTFSFDPIQERLATAQTEKLKEDTRSQKIDNDAKEENAKNMYDAQYAEQVGRNEAQKMQNQILKFEEDMKRIDNKYYEENAINRLQLISETLRHQRLENDFTEEVWDAKKQEQNLRVKQLAKAIIAQEFQNSLSEEQREGLMKIFNESVTQAQLKTETDKWAGEITRNAGQVAKNKADMREEGTKSWLGRFNNSLETCMHRLTDLIPIKL